MRVVAVLLLGIAVVSALPSSKQWGELTSPRNERIVGGTVTTIESYPYGVAMLGSLFGVSFTQSCGGAIINNRSVLTAAHCFILQPLISQWRMRSGSSFANRGGTVHPTSSIIRHPQFSILTNDHDYAVLHVQGFFVWSNSIQPGAIAGPNYNLADNQVVWAIGWGATSEGGPGSDQLRHVQVWTVNQQICNQRYSGRITPSMLCSGWLDVGGRDQCQGDSGGPLLHNNVIVGVCSWGNGCARPRYPGVNARVSFASNWIRDNA